MSKYENFLFFELQDDALTAGKPFPGFAPGEFIDMLGREVEYKPDELPDYLAGTLENIKAWQDRGMPGLPVDEKKHEKGDAAGWIVGAELGEVTDSNGKTIPVLTFLVNWTKLGVKKIKEKLQANFSPTVDNEKRAIVGGSLTNWAASVDDNGVPLFTAVELAQGIHYLQQAETTVSDDSPSWARRMMDSLNKLISNQAESTLPEKAKPADAPAAEILLSEVIGNMNDTELEKRLTPLIGNIVSKSLQGVLAEKGFTVDAPEGEGDDDVTDQGEYAELAQLLNLDQLEKGAGETIDALLSKHVETVQKKAELQYMQKLARANRSRQISEFCQRVTGGTQEHPRGLPLDSEQLREFMLRQNPDDLEYIQNALASIQENGLTDYAELGHGRKTENLKPVPDWATADLQSALERGATPDDFFAAIGLGSAAEYDLSQYVKEDK